MSGLVGVVENQNNTGEKFNPRNIVGNFYEDYVSEIFNLQRIDTKLQGKVPDLVSLDGSFYVEVKASYCKNGGVIKRDQLYKFDRDISKKRFYAFVYHSIPVIGNNYKTKGDLEKGLNENTKSIFLFPFSIVKACYNNTEPKIKKGNDEFIKFRENQAEAIYFKDEEMWRFLGLNMDNYKGVKKRKLHVITIGFRLRSEVMKPVYLSQNSQKLY